MATGHVILNPYLSIGGSNISAYIEKIAVKGNVYDEVEMNAGGDAAKWSLPGLADWSIEVTCKQSFAAGELDAILWPVIGAAAASAIVARHSQTARGASSPEYTGNGRIFGYSPLEGSIGARADVSFTIKSGDGSLLGRSVTP
jgi:hypothetical protein